MLVARGMSESTAVDRVEAERVDNNLSLRQLHDFIKSKRRRTRM